MSFNRPKFATDAQWDPDAITIVDSSLLGYSPACVFVDKQNTWYVGHDGLNRILSGTEGGVNLTEMGYGVQCPFVSDNGDMYVYTYDITSVIIRPMNGASSTPVMVVSTQCDDLFVDVNNTLYCSIGGMSQVITKSLDDSTNTLSIVAGTGCYGSDSDMLAYPAGIFVDLNSNLYVADRNNHRIQYFAYGNRNATTVAGTGAPGTITLNIPIDIVVDGNGYLFIVDYEDHRIVASGPNGFRCVVGCISGPGTPSDQLWRPESMSFDSDGNIWVADTGNGRIQKFSLKTKSPSTFCLL